MAANTEQAWPKINIADILVFYEQDEREQRIDISEYAEQKFLFKQITVLNTRKLYLQFFVLFTI